MLKLPVYNLEGKEIGKANLEPEIFEVVGKEALVHEVIRGELARRRRGTASTKTKGEVRGGGKKPWRQKGTGRARAGSIRSPLWKGGGVVFGPSPRDYSFKIPKKARRLSLKAALAAKARASELIIVEGFDFKEPKTKEALKAFQNLNLNGKTLIVLERQDEKTEKSFRNIPGAKVVSLDEMNSYHVLDNKNLVMEQKALKRLVEVLR